MDYRRDRKLLLEGPVGDNLQFAGQRRRTRDTPRRAAA
jgi:hypothetical protein